MPLFKREIDGNQSWYLDEACTILHRVDGPAIINPNITMQWYLNGKRHRDDGPAVEWDAGDKHWYKNGKLHREDGPAIYNQNGYEAWMIDGMYHRLDGPAIIAPYANIAEWWYYNVFAEGLSSKEEFEQWLKYKSFL